VQVIRALRAQERDFSISSAEAPLYEGRSNSKNAGARSRKVLGEGAAVALGEGDSMEEGGDVLGEEGEEFGGGEIDDSFGGDGGDGEEGGGWDTHFDSVSEFGSRLRQGMASDEEAEGYKDIDGDYLDEDLGSGDSLSAAADLDSLGDDDGDSIEELEEEGSFGLTSGGGGGSGSIICVDGDNMEGADDDMWDGEGEGEGSSDGLIADEVDGSGSQRRSRRGSDSNSVIGSASENSDGIDATHDELDAYSGSNVGISEHDDQVPGTFDGSDMAAAVRGGQSKSKRTSRSRRAGAIGTAGSDYSPTAATSTPHAGAARDPRHPLRAELAALSPMETRVIQMRYGLANIGPRIGSSGSGSGSGAMMMMGEGAQEPMSFTAIGTVSHCYLAMISIDCLFLFHMLYISHIPAYFCCTYTARVLGMTRQRVCQLEASAVAKMIAVGSLRHPEQTFRASR
jgi:hypothetical protein